MKYLKELCNVYWARPENALWVAKTMHEMDKVNFKGTKLDLMCGHGIWSFIKAGGDFDYDFDCYQDVVNLKKYNDGVDIQNHFTDNYSPPILKKPSYKMDYGLDWKNNNLKKCSKLNFYNNLIEADCNFKLPLEDGTFDSIFSNTIYWVENLDNILSEVNRILKKDGKVFLVNYLPAINNYLSFYKNHGFNQEWIKLIDRNRSIENKHIFTKEKWIEIFKKHNFELETYIPTSNQTFAHIWNIGLRPLAGLIIDMALKQGKKDYHQMKKEWVKILTTTLEPYLEQEGIAKTDEGKEVEAIFVLSKK